VSSLTGVVVAMELTREVAAHSKEFYWNVVRIARSIPSSQSKAAFGFTDT
jgi:hypothetical protein